MNKKSLFWQGTAQASRFTTAELVSIESKLTDARSKSLNIELEFVNLVKTAFRGRKIIEHISRFIIVRCCYWFCRISLQMLRPEISNERIFNVAGRHPVIEQILNKEKDTSFISNNCNLSDQNIWLITGPNMGGKSTFLRQNA